MPWSLLPTTPIICSHRHCWLILEWCCMAFPPSHGATALYSLASDNITSTSLLQPWDPELEQPFRPTTTAPFIIPLRQLWSVLPSFHSLYHPKSSQRIFISQNSRTWSQRLYTPILVWFDGDLELTYLFWKLLRLPEQKAYNSFGEMSVQLFITVSLTFQRSSAACDKLQDELRKQTDCRS